MGKIYRFSDHLDSIEWLEQLPGGYLSNEIDLEYNTVSISQRVTGYEIYVGPVDPYRGGDALSITLDRELNLKDYVVERLEPVLDE